ncbi:hypothetical protein B6U99_04535 [Candidatus Geothermarchaeota archaeon ex4572_27]|nr:MAG: hypothetical protein B6U99_04535 [Candidatus Geothermarchaeota archaeon ex4572_27]
MAERFDEYYRALKARHGGAVVYGSGRVLEREVEALGSAVIEGGSYERISVTGSAVIKGDVEVSRLEVSGSCSVEGSLRAGSIRSSGLLTPQPP